MTRSLRPLLRCLAILVLALGAVFDIGLMPAQDASGQDILVLCSGQGPMMMVADPVTGKLRPAPSEARKPFGCDWAASSGCGFANGPVGMPDRMPVRVADLQWAEVLWRARRKLGAVWARGPPLPV